MNLNPGTTLEENPSHAWNVKATPAIQRILAQLAANGPLSAKEIARVAFIAQSSLEGGGYLARMKQQGMIHISGWRKSHNGFTTPLYSFGVGEDQPQPKFQTLDRDSIGMAKIIAALKKRPDVDYREIARQAGLSPNTIKNARYMQILVEQKRCHISGWMRGITGHLYPVYRAGKGKSQAKPKSLSRAEISQRHRNRHGTNLRSDFSLVAQLGIVS